MVVLRRRLGSVLCNARCTRDRGPNAHRWRPDRPRDLDSAGLVSVSGSEEPRRGDLRLRAPARDSRPHRGCVQARRRAGGRCSVGLQRRVRWQGARATTPQDRGVVHRFARGACPRHPRHPQPHAPEIRRARRRVRVASPVITAGPILGTLAEVASARETDLSGVFDATQMEQVRRQWVDDPHASWKIPVFRTLISDAPFSGKITTPYGPGTVHDYMHAKVTVADDVVFVGSYNLSHSGTENAENVLEIRDASLADRMAAFIDGLRARYPTASWPT